MNSLKINNESIYTNYVFYQYKDEIKEPILRFI